MPVIVLQSTSFSSWREERPVFRLSHTSEVLKESTCPRVQRLHLIHLDNCTPSLCELLLLPILNERMIYFFVWPILPRYDHLIADLQTISLFKKVRKQGITQIMQRPIADFSPISDCRVSVQVLWLICNEVSCLHRKTNSTLTLLTRGDVRTVSNTGQKLQLFYFIS